MSPILHLAQFRVGETPAEQIVYTLGAIFILAATALTIAGAVKLFGGKKPAPVEVGPNPLHIRVTDEVPSRTEFNDLKSRVGHIAARNSLFQPLRSLAALRAGLEGVCRSPRSQYRDP